MSIMRFWVFLAWVSLLAACGGGGSPGGSNSTGSGGGITGATMTLVVLNGVNASATSISASEVATAVATLRDAAGAPAPGVIVTFGGGGLLSVAPASGTALTDANGQASVEIRASSSSSTGATLVTASATLSATTVSAQKAIAITTAPSVGVVNPQTLANALNFLDVNPSSKSIVLKGSGGNGRSESATLRFRVVDSNNTPVKGAIVDFSANPSSLVTLNIASATSDADGVVVATVSSGTTPTTVVIVAQIQGRSITSQSDQLIVSTGTASAAAFDLSASKFNLNSRISGDLSTITVRVSDANGNPVADGLPIVFTTDFGAVGTASQAGCTTLNGACTVPYSVQDPRAPDGQLATVVASTRVGASMTISGVIHFSMSDPQLLDLYDSTGTPITALNLPNVCSAVFTHFVGTPGGLAAPSGTSVTMTGFPTDLSASISNGAPIQDTLPLGVRSSLSYTVSVSTTGGTLPACVAGGGHTNTATLIVKFAAGSISVQRNITVTYPTL